MKDFLEIEGATKRFGERAALEGFSLSLRKGDFLTLLGPSGCGKTTLLRSIAGLQELSSGEIRIGGARVSAGGSKARAVLVFQDYALFPHMSVRKNVAYGLSLRGLNRSAVELKVAETLGYLGISELAERMPHQLSGGQQQRVALARALVVEPEVLLLDEPLSNLDARLRVGIRAELKRIQRELGVTTVYVTHDQSEALALSDLVAVMNRGKLIQMGSPREVYRHPADAFVADFVGTANLVEALVLESGEGSTRVSALGRTWDLGPGLPSDRVGASVSLCIRPESLRLLPAGRPDSLEGTVVQAMFEGSRVRYWVDVGQATLVVDDDEPERDFPLRSRLSVEAAPDGFHLLEEGLNG
jgi:ABC-type Fe3+/spermidine/putrescine transport system ATPase subunit